MPPLVRVVAWLVYAGTAVLASVLGVRLAWQQVPPLDPTRDGPIGLGAHISPAVLPAGYPLAADQKPLRDYLFTLAAGQDASEYVREGRVELISGTGPVATGSASGETLQAAPAGAPRDLVIVRYDGDLVLLGVASAGGETRNLWAPKKPLAEVTGK